MTPMNIVWSKISYQNDTELEKQKVDSHTSAHQQLLRTTLIHVMNPTSTLINLERPWVWLFITLCKS